MPWIEILEKVQFSPEKLAKVNLFESERMFFDVYCVSPGQQQKIHAHDDADKIYVALSGSPTVVLGDEERVLSGSPTVVLGDEERVLSAMQAGWAPAGVPHGVRNDGTEPATLLVFQARSRT